MTDITVILCVLASSAGILGSDNPKSLLCVVFLPKIMEKTFTFVGEVSVGI